jgi:hypothetical protein
MNSFGVPAPASPAPPWPAYGHNIVKKILRKQAHTFTAPSRRTFEQLPEVTLHNTAGWVSANTWRAAPGFPPAPTLPTGQRNFMATGKQIPDNANPTANHRPRIVLAMPAQRETPMIKDRELSREPPIPPASHSRACCPPWRSGQEHAHSRKSSRS